MRHEFTTELPIESGAVWTEQAVAGMVGQRPMLTGPYLSVPSEVVAAEKDDQGRIFVTLRVDDDLPLYLNDVSGISIEGEQ